MCEMEEICEMSEMCEMSIKYACVHVFGCACVHVRMQD